MKIKSEFVTNSSSTSYIVWVNDKKELTEFKKFISDMDDHPRASNSGACVYQTFNNLDELNYFTNGEKELDWCQKATGPEFEYFHEDMYTKMKNFSEQEKILCYCSIDWNVNGPFKNTKWENNIVHEGH